MEENYTNLEKALMDEIDMILNDYIDYKDIKLDKEDKISIVYDIINYEDELWENLNNIICDYIRKQLFLKQKESENNDRL